MFLWSYFLILKGRDIVNIRTLFLVAVSVIISFYLSAPSTVKAEDLNNDVTPIIQDLKSYKELESDDLFNSQFLEYITWMNDSSPDGKYTYNFIKTNNKTLYSLSVIFHEKVEFKNWLLLGHKLEDIMNGEYYQKHYPEVYPIAHRKALIEEINLIKYFAKKNKYPNIPELAYILVSPVIQDYNTNIERVFRRVKYNLEYEAQRSFITYLDLEIALLVFEMGGYKYNDRSKIKNEALEFLNK